MTATATSDRAREAAGLPPNPPQAANLPAPVAAAEVVHHSPLTDKMAYAKALAEASLLPPSYRKNPGNVLLAIEMGEALGIRPYIAIQQIHVIEGKPSASSGLISALVRRAGHRLRVRGDDMSATCEIIREDDPDYTYAATWTMERAARAGLVSKSVWKNYPAAMLKARAITEAARDACQEALSGVQYTPEELGAAVDAEGTPMPWAGAGDVAAPSADRSTDWEAELVKADTAEAVADLWRRTVASGGMNAGLAVKMTERGEALRAAAEAPADGEVVGQDAEATPDTPQTPESAQDVQDAEVVPDEPDNTPQPASEPVAAAQPDPLPSTPARDAYIGQVIEKFGPRVDDAVAFVTGGVVLPLECLTTPELRKVVNLSIAELGDPV